MTNQKIYSYHFPGGVSSVQGSYDYIIRELTKLAGPGCLAIEKFKLEVAEKEAAMNDDEALASKLADALDEVESSDCNEADEFDFECEVLSEVLDWARSTLGSAAWDFTVVELVDMFWKDMLRDVNNISLEVQGDWGDEVVEAFSILGNDIAEMVADWSDEFGIGITVDMTAIKE